MVEMVEMIAQAVSEGRKYGKGNGKHKILLICIHSSSISLGIALWISLGIVSGSDCLGVC